MFMFLFLSLMCPHTEVSTPQKLNNLLRLSHHSPGIVIFDQKIHFAQLCFPIKSGVASSNDPVHEVVRLIPMTSVLSQS